MNEYDAVIAGAGPAGCMAANTIGKSKKTLLIDQSIFPRNKPCGGILLEESIKFLKRFRMPAYVFSEPKVLRYLTLLDIDNHEEVRQERNFLNVSRSKFDEWLWKMAVRDVSFLPSTKLVDIYNNGGHTELVLEKDGQRMLIRAKYLIGADGSPSTVRRNLYGAETSMRSYMAVQEWVKPKENSLEDAYFIFDSSITNFYSWVIPKSHLLLIGSGVPPSGSDVYQALDKLKEHVKFLRGVGVPEIREAKFTFVTSSMADVRLGLKNVMLVGEAAGLISPSTAEGISYALRSGYFSGKAIVEHFDDAQPAYREMCAGILQEMSEKIKKNRALSNLKTRQRYLRSLKSQKVGPRVI